MISFTPEDLKLLATDSAACDLCGNEDDTVLLSGNVRACKNNEDCTGRIIPRKRFEAALDALPDLHLRKIFIKPYGVEAQFIYSPHDEYEKWFTTVAYESERELYDELSPILEDTTMTSWFKASGNLWKYLGTEMIEEGRDYKLTIKTAVPEEVTNQDGTDMRVVISFKNFDTGWICGNKTNVRMMIDIFGKDIEDCIGQKIVLYKEFLNMRKGEKVFGIRIDEAKTRAANTEPRATTSTEIKDMQTAVTDPIEQEPLFTHEQADIMADEGAYQD